MVKLVSAKCPSCGASLELDDNLKRTECEFCRTSIIVDEAIQKYEVEIKGKIKVSGIQDEDDKIEIAKKYIATDEKKKAIAELEEALKINPFHLEALKLSIELGGPNWDEKLNRLEKNDFNHEYREFIEEEKKFLQSVEKNMQEAEIWGQKVKSLTEKCNKHSIKEILSLYGCSDKNCDVPYIKEHGFDKYLSFNKKSINDYTIEMISNSEVVLKAKDYSNHKISFYCDRTIDIDEKIRMFEEFENRNKNNNFFSRLFSNKNLKK